LTALVLGVGVASAQYYYIPNENAGTNPKGLNNDNEYPWGGGIPSGWTLLMGAGGTTPEWSAEQNLPFNFDFNGAAVTSYLVSNSGIVTFDVATTLDAPSYTKSALPHASIPDKSVCIWGINGQWST